LNPQERADCGNISGLNLAGVDLSRASNGGVARHMRGIDAHDSVFTSANLSHSVLTSANLMRARVDNANLFATYLVGARLEGASFQGSTAHYSAWSGTAGGGAFGWSMSGFRFYPQQEHRTNFRNADLSNSFVDLDLLGADIRGARFQNAFAAFGDPAGLPGTAFDPNRWTSQLNVYGGDATGASFRGARLSRLELSYTIANQLELQDANLGELSIELGRNDTLQDLNATRLRARLFGIYNGSGDGTGQQRVSMGSFELAQLQESRIWSVNLHRMRMAGANLGYAQVIGTLVNYSDLRGARIANSHLSGSTFHEVDGSQSSFQGSIVLDTGFVGGKLVQADLSRTRIERATFAYVDLTGANFSCAHLNGVNLQNVALSHTTLNCAKISGAMQFPLELRTLEAQLARGMVLSDNGNYVGAPGQVEACRQICGPQW
jgi:uncharacterized protein YjbI with pentapeptide repeats